MGAKNIAPRCLNRCQSVRGKPSDEPWREHIQSTRNSESFLGVDSELPMVVREKVL